MNQRYQHLLEHPHHVSGKHTPMKQEERAAQFGAFQALTGYEEEIAETARLVNAVPQLTEDQQAALNDVFRQLLQLDQPLIALTYFVPDISKNGGAYLQCIGHFRFLDMAERRLKLVEGIAVSLDEICGIELLESYPQEVLCDAG